MSYVNIKWKCNNEVVNFSLAEAEWVRSWSRIRTSGPRAPPRLRILVTSKITSLFLTLSTS